MPSPGPEFFAFRSSSTPPARAARAVAEPHRSRAGAGACHKPAGLSRDPRIVEPILRHLGLPSEPVRADPAPPTPRELFRGDARPIALIARPASSPRLSSPRLT